jgi:hypothetical protein
MPDVRYDELGFGFSYLLDDRARRTSHALADNGRVWLVDPVDVPEAIERARGLGEPAAVLQLLDRHNRDCDALARRLGVPHLRVPTALPGTPFEVLRVTWWPVWREVAMWWPTHRTLVVPEAVGTLPLFAVGPGPVGVHPARRLLPPDALRGYQPDHLLVGHGAGVHGPRAAAGLEEALARSRSDLPRLLARLPALLRG